MEYLYNEHIDNTLYPILNDLYAPFGVNISEYSIRMSEPGSNHYLDKIQNGGYEVGHNSIYFKKEDSIINDDVFDGLLNNALLNKLSTIGGYRNNKTRKQYTPIKDTKVNTKKTRKQK